MSEWISIKDRLPELKNRGKDRPMSADPVLVFDGEQYGIGHHWKTESYEYFKTYDSDDGFGEVTHWQPLRPPEKE